MIRGFVASSTLLAVSFKDNMAASSTLLVLKPFSVIYPMIAVMFATELGMLHDPVLIHIIPRRLC